MLIDTYSEHTLSLYGNGRSSGSRRQTQSSGLPEKMSVTIVLAQ